MIWRKDKILELISNSDEMVRRSLLVLYALQTEDEQCSGSTSESNGYGFNGVDAEILSSFSEQLRSKGYLSTKQLTIARKKLCKYSNQLLQVANGSIVIDPIDLVYKK